MTQFLADTAAKVGSGVMVKVAATGGDPAQRILHYATTHSIDLIVLGTHGRTGVSRLLLGSVAEKVLRGARCRCSSCVTDAVGASIDEPACGLVRRETRLRRRPEDGRHLVHGQRVPAGRRRSRRHSKRRRWRRRATHGERACGALAAALSK
jgi:hypothetical protein